MNKHCLPTLFYLLFSMFTGSAQQQAASYPGNGIPDHELPDSNGWWKKNNLRVIQVNLPDYEAATLDPDSLVKDLQDFSANTLLINAGGIMAFYPTRLPFQYTNPYMKEHMLGDVIEKCHARGIRVIVRFDFSRVHESIFKAHPDWCYLSAKGDRIINTNMYAVTINAPYVQDGAFRIIGEVMDLYPIDGIFLNMPGYQTGNAYEGKYYGIDQNEFDRKRFAAFSQEERLPLEEKKDDPLYKKYEAFKKATQDDWSKRLFELVKGKNKQIAICTYSDKYVDIIRHESQTNSLPYWPYSASDNVGNAGNSYPHHIISNSSIQQISFQSRYNAVEPEETSIRLYENIANGSGLDVSLIGDLRGYEDERNFDIIKKVYAFHKRFEIYFGNYSSVAKIALIAPGPWPTGGSMQEYRGILLMLKEAHIPFDIVEDAQIANRADKIKTYRLVILPEITYLSAESILMLKEACRQGTNLIATNRSLFDDPATLLELFGAKAVKIDYEGSGNYLDMGNKRIFKRFSLQKMVYWKYNLAQYDLSGADSVFLPILTKGRPGPPEIVGGHVPSGYYAIGVKKYGDGKCILLPENIGKLYYLQGYKEHRNILLDIIDYAYPESGRMLKTDAPERVECILRQYSRNEATQTRHSNKTVTIDPGYDGANNTDGLILHLVNLTGFSGNTYFKPLPVYALHFELPSVFKPSKIYTLSDDGKRPLPFTWEKGTLRFSLSQLDAYTGIVIDK